MITIAQFWFFLFAGAMLFAFGFVAAKTWHNPTKWDNKRWTNK